MLRASAWTDKQSTQQCPWVDLAEWSDMARRRDDLHDWYLAYLRKNALSRKKYQDLTPMALVDSDKEMLKQIVYESAQPDLAPVIVTASWLDKNYWLIQLGLSITWTALLIIATLTRP